VGWLVVVMVVVVVVMVVVVVVVVVRGWYARWVEREGEGTF